MPSSPSITSAVEDFSFKIPGPLLAWMRPDRGFGRIFDPPQQVAYKKMVGLICKQQMRWSGLYSPLEGPVSLSMEAVFPHPKSTPHRMFKDSKPDLDNLIKNVKDALKGVAWVDDQQVAYYGRCAKWFLPPGASGEGYAWVYIGRPPADEYPFLYSEEFRSSRAVQGNARQHGPASKGGPRPRHPKGDGGTVDAGSSQHPADGSLREQG